MRNRLRASFVQWVAGISKTVKGVIAIDGKTLRRSHDHESGKKALHVVSAWAVAQSPGVSSACQPREKSNEITAIPVLLRQLALKGCIVTIDAMGTRARDCRADHRPGWGVCPGASRDNHGNLSHHLKATFPCAEKDGFPTQYSQP